MCSSDLVINAGSAPFLAGAVTVTDDTTGIGEVLDSTLLPIDLQIPVQFIPANNSTIPATTPGTIIDIINPAVTVAPVGTVVPPTVPLNSLTPTDFNVTPAILDIPMITNAGTINDSDCF